MTTQTVYAPTLDPQRPITAPLYKRIAEAKAELAEYAKHIADTYALSVSIGPLATTTGLIINYGDVQTDAAGVVKSPEQIEFETNAAKRGVPLEWYGKSVKFSNGLWRIYGVNPSHKVHKRFILVRHAKTGKVGIVNKAIIAKKLAPLAVA